MEAKKIKKGYNRESTGFLVVDGFGCCACLHVRFVRMDTT